jgi:hypothetical protein
MARLIGAIVIVLAILVGIGFYMDWFHVSTNQSGQKSNVEISVDKQKIQEDEEAAKKKVEELKDKAKQKVDEIRK